MSEDPRPRIGFEPTHFRQNVGHILPQMRGDPSIDRPRLQLEKHGMDTLESRVV